VALPGLRTGFAVAPGPLLVPAFTSSPIAWPAGVVAALGCALFAAGNVILLASVASDAPYATALLPGWLVISTGVGPALPTIISSATADLPPVRTATGGAVVTVSRQIGLVLGISVLVAVLGSSTGFAQAHAAFQRGWWAVAVFASLAMLATLGMTPRRTRMAASVLDLPAPDPAAPTLVPSSTH
jgi:hypothetical protein